MKTYALCGLSTRGIAHFALPLIGNPQLPEYGNYSAHGRLVAIVDNDPERVAAFNRNQGLAIPHYPPDAFDRMIAEANPDVVAVAPPDVHHAEYIIAALRHHRDVISEKPMVIDGRQAQAVIEAERASRGRVRVAHNYRYVPLHKAIKRMILDGWLGKIVHAQMIYLLDTYHGASYFQRWNRERAMSGGLTVTKCCHHFDLLNWWLDDLPDEVFAYGALNLKRLTEFTSLGPVLVSPSRKSFLAGPENLPVSGRLPATLAATTVAVVHGARFIRTHDVRATALAAEAAVQMGH